MNLHYSYSAYALLGVLPNASDQELLIAFRNRRDLLADELGAEFQSSQAHKDLSEAYSWLVDPEFRCKYDQAIAANLPLPAQTDQKAEAVLDFGVLSMETHIAVAWMLSGYWHGAKKCFGYAPATWEANEPATITIFGTEHVVRETIYAITSMTEKTWNGKVACKASALVMVKKELEL